MACELVTRRTSFSTSYSDIPDSIIAQSHTWKLQTLDSCYCELKIRFPITAEMLQDIRNLIRTKYPMAEEALQIEILKKYRHPHRWKPLLKYMGTSDALVHAIWDYTLNSLTNSREHKDFHELLLKKCIQFGLIYLEEDKEFKSLKTSMKRGLIKPLVGV